jgi:hypothetical protein
MPLAVSEAAKTKLLEIVNSDHFHYLYGRWQDEKQYEDINDYGASVAKTYGVTVLKSSGSPFEFEVSIPGEDGSYAVQVHVRGREQVGRYRRVA